MPSHLNRALALGCAGVLLALAPAAAHARAGVYGGATRAGDPIVLTSDAKAQKLTGAVFRVRVDGQDDWWPIAASAAVRPAPSDPSTLPMNQLTAERNAKGAFKAAYMTRLGSEPGKVTLAGIELAGTLKPGKASGTISGWVTVTDTATGDLAGTYMTGTIKWTAERSAGRIYGGALGKTQPIVLELNRRGTKVSDVWLSCYTATSTPPGMYWSSSEALSNFPLTGSRFGDAFTYKESQGEATVDYDWKVAGKLTAQSAKGTIALDVQVQRPSDTLTFTMPPTAFKAATG